jgi:hypothetical protein
MKINLLAKYIIRGFLSLCFFGLSTLHAQLTNSEIKQLSEKSDPTVSLEYSGTLIMPSFTEFSVPVKIKTGNEISAISLGFYFPEEYLEITGMELANGTHGFSYNVTDSLFRMAWSDVNPITITDEDTIITLKMKSLDLAGLTGTIRLGLYEFSEFADKSANVIEGVVLEIPEIKYLEPDSNDFISGVYPNPFDDYTSINFILETESKVKISLFNLVGIKIMQEEDATYSEGTHQVRLYALNLSKGIYLLKLEVINENNSATKLIKIMVGP